MDVATTIVMIVTLAFFGVALLVAFVHPPAPDSYETLGLTGP